MVKLSEPLREVSGAPPSGTVAAAERYQAAAHEAAAGGLAARAQDPTRWQRSLWRLTANRITHRARWGRAAALKTFLSWRSLSLPLCIAMIAAVVIGMLALARQDHLMTTTDCVGYVASSLVLATFCAKEMVLLRATAISSNVAFITYGCSAQLWPIVLLHAIMLPLNVIRLREVLLSSRADHRNGGGTDNDVHARPVGLQNYPTAGEDLDAGRSAAVVVRCDARPVAARMARA